MTAIAIAKNPVTLQTQQAVIPLNPLAGDTGQTASYATAWLPIPAGSVLQLLLAVTAMVLNTTASFEIETCNQTRASVTPGAPDVAVDTPRSIGWFQGVSGTAPLPSPTVPFTSQMSGAGVCGNFIRVVATLGSGAAPAWTIAGKAIAAAHATQV